MPRMSTLAYLIMSGMKSNRSRPETAAVTRFLALATLSGSPLLVSS